MWDSVSSGEDAKRAVVTRYTRARGDRSGFRLVDAAQRIGCGMCGKEREVQDNNSSKQQATRDYHKASRLL